MKQKKSKMPKMPARITVIKDEYKDLTVYPSVQEAEGQGSIASGDVVAEYALIPESVRRATVILK